MYWAVVFLTFVTSTGYVRVQACGGVCLCVIMCVGVSIRVCSVCTCVGGCLHTCVFCVWVWVWVCLHMCMFRVGVCVHVCGCMGVSAYVHVPCACVCTCVGAAQWQGQMSIFHVGRVFSPQLTKHVYCGCTWTLSNT